MDGVHKPKKIYNKAQNTHHPSTAPESFMRDARASGRHSTVSLMAREVKQLTWFQRHILCIGIDTHKGQYEAYCKAHSPPYLRCHWPSTSFHCSGSVCSVEH